MAADHYSTWDATKPIVMPVRWGGTANLGTFSISRTPSAGGSTETVTGSALLTNMQAHIAAPHGTFPNQHFAVQLQSALNFEWDVTEIEVLYRYNMLRYTITGLDSDYDYTFSPAAAAVLGIGELEVEGSALTGDNSDTIDGAVRPIMVARTELEDWCNPSQEFESGSQSSQAVSDSGIAYGIARTEAVREREWRVEFEPPHATLAEYRLAPSMPDGEIDRIVRSPHAWTWQDFVSHSRTVYPIMVIRHGGSIDTNLQAVAVGYLRQDTAQFTEAVRAQHHQNYLGHWWVRLAMIQQWILPFSPGDDLPEFFYYGGGPGLGNGSLGGAEYVE